MVLKVTLLRAYVTNRFGLSNAEYIEKCKLPDDFPMAPPQYIENKRKLALKGGLGRSVRANRERQKPAANATQAATAKTAETAEASKRGRKPKVQAEGTPTIAKGKGAGSRRTLTLFATEGQPV